MPKAIPACAHAWGPPPYAIGEGIDIIFPSGWIYVPGTSTYNSSNESVVGLNNPAPGPGNPQPEAVMEGCGTANISGLNLVFTADNANYVAKNCSTSMASI